MCTNTFSFSTHLPLHSPFLQILLALNNKTEQPSLQNIVINGWSMHWFLFFMPLLRYFGDMSTHLAVLTNPTAIDLQQVQNSQRRSWILIFTTFGTLASLRQTCPKEIFSRPSPLWKSWRKYCGEGAFRSFLVSRYPALIWLARNCFISSLFCLWQKLVSDLPLSSPWPMSCPLSFSLNMSCWRGRSSLEGTWQPARVNPLKAE